MAHNIARWTARIGLGDLQVVTTKTLRRRASLRSGGTDHPLGAPPHTCIWPQRWPWEAQFDRALASIARPATPCLTAAAATGRHPANRTVPANSRQSGLRVPLAASSPRSISP